MFWDIVSAVGAFIGLGVVGTVLTFIIMIIAIMMNEVNDYV